MNSAVVARVISRDDLAATDITTAVLRNCPDIDVRERVDESDRPVIVAVARTIDEAMQLFQQVSLPERPLVIVTDTVTPTDILTAVQAGASAILDRTEAQTKNLIDAIRAANNGNGVVPQSLLDAIHGRTHSATTSSNTTDTNLTPREREILKLIANGYSNADIARALDCSQHTVKNALYELMGRLQLRNRVHAAAYAVREGIV